MKRTALFLLCALSSLASDWKIAVPGWHYEFPHDHHAHRDFKTEWWYFTGNLFDDAGHHFGYELTFFREGIRAGERDANASRFRVDDLKFAHFAISDLTSGRFQFEQKTSRGAFGEAGFDHGARLAWIENWTLDLTGSDSFDLTAESKGKILRLHLTPAKPPVIHGENGVSLKGNGAGHASHYYSLPRLTSRGELTENGVSRALRGESWFDHEWATSQLAPGQVGWNWLCLQWDDGTELMLYQMRQENGEADPNSSGTWIERDGTATHLSATDFEMTPTAFWKSNTSGARYPIAWRVDLLAQKLNFEVRAALENQELPLGPLTYWEGAIDAAGMREGKKISGRGYLELTGYAGPLGELTR